MKVLYYTLRRLLWTIPTFLGALVVIFFLTQAIPGNAALSRVGQYVTPETIAAVKRSMGIDQPVPVQFVIYVQHITQGNLGHSWKTGNDVTVDLADRLPATIELAVYTLLVAIPLGLILGIAAAAWKGSWFDRVVQSYIVLGLGVPVFWFSLMSIYLLFFILGWVPAPTGRIDILDSPPPHVTGFYTIDSLLAGDSALFGRILSHLILPVLALAFNIAAPVARLTYTTMSGQLESDYIRAATAAGLSRWLILRKFALKNIMIPVVTMLGAIVRTLLGGAVLIEIVFSWPGIGRYAVESMLVADLAPLQAVILLVTLFTLLINILVDVSYFWFDPRIRVA